MKRERSSTTNLTVPSASFKTKSALDTVVSSLVRAAIGGDVSSVKDEDLDKYVADLILKESREKSKLFDKVGTRAYLPNTGVPECTLPKTNKRFLLNIVKSTDGHNRALLRQAQELANARLRELRGRDLPDRLPRDEEREGKRRGRDCEDGNGRKRRRSEEEGSGRRERRRSDEASSRNVGDTIGGRSMTRDMSWKGRREPSRTPSDTEGTTSVAIIREADRTPIKFKGRGKIAGSKMDKYFDPSYDPACDVSDAEPDLWGRLPIAFAVKHKNSESSKTREGKRISKKMKEDKEKGKKPTKRRRKERDRSAKRSDSEEGNSSASYSSSSSDSEGKTKKMKDDKEKRKKSKKRRRKTRDRTSKRSDSEEGNFSLSYSSSSSDSSLKTNRRSGRKEYADYKSRDSRDERKAKQRVRGRSKEAPKDTLLGKERPQKIWDGIPKLPPGCPW